MTNMPGAVGRTSTFALCNVTLPWALQIANRGLPAAAELSAPMSPGDQHLPRAKSPTGPLPKPSACLTTHGLNDREKLGARGQQ